MNVLKKMTMLVVLVVLVVMANGCATTSHKSDGSVSFLDSLKDSVTDTTALSVFGPERLDVLGLDKKVSWEKNNPAVRERQLLEKRLQEKLSDKSVRATNIAIDRTDGSKLNVQITLDSVYIPQKPVGFKCRKLRVRAQSPNREELAGKGTMCFDTISQQATWKRKIR